jgi:hypothetical protein
MTGPTLFETLERARREEWPRLALCAPRAEVIRELRKRGWAEPYLVVADQPVANPETVVAPLAKIESLKELAVRYPSVGDKGAQTIAKQLTSLTSLDLADQAIGEAGALAIAERLTSLTSLYLRAYPSRFAEPVWSCSRQPAWGLSMISA